ncbi:hypothetical protein [Paenibacillus sp. FSL H8-0332]
MRTESANRLWVRGAMAPKVIPRCGGITVAGKSTVAEVSASA